MNMLIKYFKKFKELIIPVRVNQDICNQQIHKVLTKLDNIDSILKERVLQDNMRSSEHTDSLIDERLSRIADRLEFVREEILFELRVKTGSFKDKVDHNEIKARVINNAKIDSGIKRINVGCGHIQPDGYINVDIRDVPGIDIISSASALPFADNLLDEIYCSHLVEHFTELELERIIFPHWWKKLNSDGILKVIVPDAQSMMTAYLRGEMSFDDLRKVTYGAQDYEGDFHYTMFTVDSLKVLLEKSNFTHIELVENNRINGLCREMELIAHKGK